MLVERCGGKLNLKAHNIAQELMFGMRSADEDAMYLEAVTERKRWIAEVKAQKWHFINFIKFCIGHVQTCSGRLRALRSLHIPQVVSRHSRKKVH